MQRQSGDIASSYLQITAEMSLVVLPHENDVTNTSRTKRANVSCTNGRVIEGRAASLASSVSLGDSTM